MLPTLLTLALLTQAAPPAPAGAGATPPPWDVAKILYLNGDLAKAVDTVLKCQKTAPKKCLPLKKPLVEFQYLASKLDTLTPQEAAQFLAYGRQVVRDTPSKLAEPVIARFVTGPLTLAKARIDGGDPDSARGALEAVLEVDPQHAEAKALLKSLAKPRAAKDAGR